MECGSSAGLHRASARHSRRVTGGLYAVQQDYPERAARTAVAPAKRATAATAI